MWVSPRFEHPHSQNPSDMGIPFYITLAIWVKVRVRVAGDAHITRALGIRIPTTGGSPYHCDRGINSSIHSVSFIAPLNEDTRKSVRKSPYAPVSIFPFHFLSDKMLSRRFRQTLGQVLVCKKNHETTAIKIMV